MVTTLEMPAEARTEQLPFATSSVTVARSLVIDDLTTRGPGGRTIADANIVVGELVMNSVRHGRPIDPHVLEISWVIGIDRLLFGVRDAGHVDHLVATMPAPDAVGGRGLAMIAMLCDRWSYDTVGGTRVIAELHLPPA